MSERAAGLVIDGRWTLTERIGSGGMGDIFRAIDRHDGSSYALKLLRVNLLDEPELVARFEREIANTARIRHPNAVRIRGSGRSRDGQPYLVMDEIRGRPLSALIAAEAPLPPQRVAHLGRQIASGLGAAHAVGVIHRDLKPENVMISQREGADHAVVFDFGLSIGRADGRLTEVDHRIGTPGYMAPEYLIDGRSSARSDLYAVGVVLYEMTCGEVPFRGPPYKVFQQQASREIPPLHERCSTPRWLSDAIGTLTRRDPDERPADAADAVRLLTEPAR